MTAPVTTPPTCSVWVDGIRMADGQPGEPDDAPCVLTDLKVTWGRANTMDQPAPGTATFRVMDVAGGQQFLNVIRLGSKVGIRTEGTVWADPTVSMLPDGFGPAYYSNAVVTPAGASRSLVPSSGTDPMLATVPPAALSSDPSAWNSVARSKANQTWRLTGTVTLQADLGTMRQRVDIRPVAYSNPNGSGAVVGEPILSIGPGLAGAQSFSVDFTPPDDVWVGIRFDIWPTGPRWSDLADDPTWASLGATPRWVDLATAILGAPTLLAPASGVSKQALVFSGRVTDLQASYDLGIGATVVNVIATDYMSHLANRFVGDAPWSAEPLWQRFNRIMSTAGQGSVTQVVDDAPAALTVSYRDVDSQPVGRLLQELAVSAGGVLWSATNLVTGEFLWLEDIGNRAALQVLTKDPDGVIRIHPTNAAVLGAVEISACSLLLEPVEWHQTYDDYSTQVALTWLDQVVDPGPPSTIRPTSREILAVDDAAEVATGRRRLGVGTQLSNSQEATSIASIILGRARVAGWRVAGLTWQLSPQEPLTQDELGVMLTILDGTTRLGLPIMLVDLPEWSPMGTGTVPLYLEGARMSNHDGYWTIELITSDARNQGAAAIPWTALKTDWLWNQFDPEISWDELAGVGIA